MLQPPPVRPTFELSLTASVDGTVQQLQAALERDAAHHPVEVLGQHVVLTIAPDARHFWSPWLTMETVAAGAGSVLHARFSPKPAIWTGFMLSYISLITAGCFGLMFAASFLVIGRSAWLSLVLGCACLALALGMYAAAQVGQRLAHAQMAELRDLVHDALAELRAEPPAAE